MWDQAHQQLKSMSKQYAARHMKRSSDTLKGLPEALRDQVDQVLTRFVAVIPRDISIEKKVALLYQVLTCQITYDHEGMNKTKLPYTFIGALCRKKAVCMGIAELFTHLCGLVGVEAVTVIGYCCSAAQLAKGEDGGELHAWVMVRLSDNRWYHADPTWDLHRESCRNWRPQWFLLSDGEMARHYWLPGDYPKAETRFQDKIELNRKGVEILCQHWKNLTAKFEQQEMTKHPPRAMPSDRETV